MTDNRFVPSDDEVAEDRLRFEDRPEDDSARADRLAAGGHDLEDDPRDDGLRQERLRDEDRAGARYDDERDEVLPGDRDRAVATGDDDRLGEDRLDDGQRADEDDLAARRAAATQGADDGNVVVIEDIDAYASTTPLTLEEQGAPVERHPSEEDRAGLGSLNEDIDLTDRDHDDRDDRDDRHDHDHHDRDDLLDRDDRDLTTSEDRTTRADRTDWDERADRDDRDRAAGGMAAGAAGGSTLVEPESHDHDHDHDHDPDHGTSDRAGWQDSERGRADWQDAERGRADWQDSDRGRADWQDGDREGTHGTRGGDGGIDEVRDGGYGIGSAAPLEGGRQPFGHPVKAFHDTQTYVVEGMNGYEGSDAHVWFVDDTAAQNAGFRRADG